MGPFAARSPATIPRIDVQPVCLVCATEQGAKACASGDLCVMAGSVAQGPDTGRYVHPCRKCKLDTHTQCASPGPNHVCFKCHAGGGHAAMAAAPQGAQGAVHAQEGATGQATAAAAAKPAAKPTARPRPSSKQSREKKRRDPVHYETADGAAKEANVPNPAKRHRTSAKAPDSCVTADDGSRHAALGTALGDGSDDSDYGASGSDAEGLDDLVQDPQSGAESGAESDDGLLGGDDAPAAARADAVVVAHPHPDLPAEGTDVTPEQKAELQQRLDLVSESKRMNTQHAYDIVVNAEEDAYEYIKYTCEEGELGGQHGKHEQGSGDAFEVKRAKSKKQVCHTWRPSSRSTEVPAIVVDMIFAAELGWEPSSLYQERYDKAHFEAKSKGYELPTGATLAPLLGVGAARGVKDKRVEVLYAKPGDSIEMSTKYAAQAQEHRKPGGMRASNKNGRSVLRPKMLKLVRDDIDAADPLFWHFLGVPYAQYETDAKNANVYLFTTGLDGQGIKPTNATELIHAAGVMIMLGRCGNHPDIAKRFDTKHPAHCAEAHSMFPGGARRLQELNRIRHYSDDSSPEADRKSPDYKPDHKFHACAARVAARTNEVVYFPKEANLTLDEFSVLVRSHGPCIQKTPNKKASSCLQWAALVDSWYTGRLFAVTNRHKKDKTQAQLDGDISGQPGPAEVLELWNQLDPDTVKCKGTPSMTTTADNYFVDQKFGEYLNKCTDESQFMATRAKGEAAPGCAKFVHRKTPGRSSSAQRGQTDRLRMLSPIVVVQDEATVAQTSFMSQGICNFFTKGIARTFRTYYQRKSRGKGEQKRSWGAAMNEAREFYLQTYGRIDNAGQAIKFLRVATVSRSRHHNNAIDFWKAFQTIFGRSLHDEYLTEHAEGNGHGAVAVMETDEYWLMLARRMMAYDPRDGMYPHCLTTAACEKNNQRVRGKAGKSGKTRAAEAAAVADMKGKKGHFNIPPHGVRFASTVSAFLKGHGCEPITVASKKPQAKKAKRKRPPTTQKCYACGNPVRTQCTTCKVPLHFFTSGKDPADGNLKYKTCFSNWHDVDNNGACWAELKATERKHATAAAKEKARKLDRAREKLADADQVDVAQLDTPQKNIMRALANSLVKKASSSKSKVKYTARAAPTYDQDMSDNTEDDAESEDDDDEDTEKEDREKYARFAAANLRGSRDRPSKKPSGKTPKK